MAYFGSTALVYICLSRVVVADASDRKGPHGKLAFFAAFSGMDSVKNCIDFLADRDFGMKGWRIFSEYASEAWSDGRVLQKVTGFEPILLRGVAIAYARPAREAFCFADDTVDFAARHALPGEVYKLLNGGR